MKTNKIGISLIVLIVTIIVIIILAAVVILTISKNNPVESARKARFMEDVRSFQDDLSLTVSKQYTNVGGQRDSKITTSDYDKMKEYIPSYKKEYDGKLLIQNDELKYLENKVTQKEKEWLENLGIRVKDKTAAEIVLENPIEYYGKYILNYSTNHEETKEAVEKWQIFHSDGKNMYLIADDYISYLYVPKGKGGNSVTKYDDDYKFAFNKIIYDYIGSEDILANSNIKKWIKWVEIYQNSNINEIKAVAYMLDTDVWNIYVGSMADYAIGAPTLDMFSESYNNTHDKKIQIDSSSDPAGYNIKWDDSSRYGSGISGLSTQEMNNLYVIDNTSKATNMWIASPSSYGGIDYGRLSNVTYDGKIDYGGYYGSYNYRSTLGRI